MTANLNTPNFPVISWQVRPTGTLTVTNVATANTLPLDFDSGAFDAYWGFAPGVLSAISDTQSLMGVVLTAVETFLQGDGSPLATVSGVYQFSAQKILTQIVYSNGAGNLDFTFDSLDTAKQFGFTTVTTIVPLGSTTLTINTAGYWSPQNLTCYDDRVSIAPNTFSSQSLDGDIVKLRAWVASRTRRQLTFPYVRPAFLWLYRREDPNYATPAGQDTADPNNLYENYLEAARRNNVDANATTFRIYGNTGNPAPYRLAKVVDPKELEDPAAKIRDNSNGAALYFNVSVLLQDYGDDGSGGI